MHVDNHGKSKQNHRPARIPVPAATSGPHPRLNLLHAGDRTLPEVHPFDAARVSSGPLLDRIYIDEGEAADRRRQAVA